MSHTHEDMDTGFRRTAETLRRSEAETLPELKAIIPDCYQIKALFDTKGWIESHLNTISQHSKVLHFKFFRDKDRNLKFSYKGSYDQAWKMADVTVLTSIPHGKPKLILPHFDHTDCDNF